MQKTLGLELSSLSDDLRKKFKIKDSVKGVRHHRRRSECRDGAPDKRLSAGDVIVEVQYQEPSATRPICKAASISSRAQGKKVAVLLVSNADGETRFVALSLQ